MTVMKGTLDALYATMLALSLVSSSMAQAPEAAQSSGEGERSFAIKSGSGGGYSAGVNEDHYQARLFTDAAFEIPAVKITAGYTWLYHYQLSDGFGNFDYGNLNRVGLDIELSPVDFLSVSAGYRFTIGSRSYESHQYSGEASLYYRSLSLAVSFDGKQERYTYNWLRHINDYLAVSGELGYDFSDRFGMEMDYAYSRDDYRSAGADYRKNMFHLGASGRPAEPLFISGGAGIGSDSSNYMLYTVDLGGTITVSEGVTINILGAYTYYQSESSSSSLSSGMRGGSGSGSGLAGGGSGRNPYISTSRLGDSFSGWDVSISATMQLYRVSDKDGD